MVMPWAVVVAVPWDIGHFTLPPGYSCARMHHPCTLACTRTPPPVHARMHHPHTHARTHTPPTHHPPVHHPPVHARMRTHTQSRTHPRLAPVHLTHPPRCGLDIWADVAYVMPPPYSSLPPGVGLGYVDLYVGVNSVPNITANTGIACRCVRVRVCACACLGGSHPCTLHYRYPDP